MTREEANRIIHESRGLCWHEHKPNTLSGGAFDIYHPGGVYICQNCGLMSDVLFAFNNPDYISKLGFWDAWEWAKGEDWFDDFQQERWVKAYGGPISFNSSAVYLLGIPAIDINPETFATVLAEYIKERNHAR